MTETKRNETTGTVHAGIQDEAVRLIKGFEVAAVTSKILRILKQT